MLDYSHALHIFITLISILNPLGAIPVFLAITAGDTEAQRKNTIRRTIIALTMILFISAYFGSSVLDFFGIDIHSFRIAGGILLLLMAINMLHAKTPSVKTNEHEQNEAVEKEDVSVVPLAIPLLAGPGSISTMILLSTSMQSVGEQIVLGGIIVIVVLVIWPILLLSEAIGERLGRTGLNVATRIMGLLLASIAVRFIMEGVMHFYKSNL